MEEGIEKIVCCNFKYYVKILVSFYSLLLGVWRAYFPANINLKYG